MMITKQLLVDKMRKVFSVYLLNSFQFVKKSQEKF